MFLKCEELWTATYWALVWLFRSDSILFSSKRQKELYKKVWLCHVQEQCCPVASLAGCSHFQKPLKDLLISCLSVTGGHWVQLASSLSWHSPPAAGTFLEYVYYSILWTYKMRSFNWCFWQKVSSCWSWVKLFYWIMLNPFLTLQQDAAKIQSGSLFIIQLVWVGVQRWMGPFPSNLFIFLSVELC